jgi:hypothetical protein
MSRKTITEHSRTESERRAVKVARARRLTDPLGAAGQRHPAARIAREGKARRALFASSIAGFLLIGGAIAKADQAAPADHDVTAPTSGSSAGQATIVRGADGRLYVIANPNDLAQQVQHVQPHVRSKSS